jgi:ribonuclease HI
MVITAPRHEETLQDQVTTDSNYIVKGMTEWRRVEKK